MAIDRPAALVISLDFELHWGLRDVFAPDGRYAGNLHGAREVVPRLLDLFAEMDVAATWATVGFLFALSRAELEEVSPDIRARYANRTLDPYLQALGEDEASDPLHFAPSLIERISSSPRQEVASHTYSHFYCLEQGASREAFAADLDSAVEIAARRGITLRSLVFPRNQIAPGYLDLLPPRGIRCYRGAAGRLRRSRGPLTRAVSLLGSYVDVGGDHLIDWADVPQGELANVPASFFLRPVTRSRTADRLRFERLDAALESAARSGKIVHLWWHPHNFGARPNENVAFLRALLDRFRRYRDELGMTSMSMDDVATLVSSDSGSR